MNSLTEAQLEPLSLRFKKKETEREFGLQDIPKAKKALYVGVVMSGLSSIFIFGVDYLALGRFELILFLIRVVFFGAVNALMALVVHLNIPKTRRHYNILAFSFAIYSMIFQFGIAFGYPELGVYYLLILMMMATLPLITLTGMSFRYNAPMAVLVVTAFVLKILLFDDYELYTKLFEAFVALMFGGIVISTGYILERAQRQEWWVIQGLTAQREALVAKNKELEQFAYIASHDLQEPLRSITSFTQLLDEDYREQIGEDGGKYLNFLMEASERMRRLIKGLLDYSRLGREATLGRVDAAAMMKEIQLDLAVAIKECKAEVKVGPLPVFNAYELEFRQLLQNLVSNAIKFRKPGTAPMIDVSARQVGSAWEFSIKDNGIGIAKEHQEKIFLIFQRLHNRSQYDGTGIGLANCVKIVAMHGGKIWVESEKDQGSTFKFTIPIS
ncbi:MAG: ATP-binding protein [Bacteroidia bacterium]